jgi:NHLM bacteriocin system ABC transporter ATP-binding protein
MRAPGLDHTESGGAAPVGASATPVPPFAGETLDLGSNRPFVVGPDSVWFVERGDLDVFSVPMTADGPGGPRRHLLRVSAGQLLVGFTAGSPARGFVAVPTNGSRLVQAPRAHLRELLEAPWSAERVRALIEALIMDLCGALLRGGAPRAPLELTPGATIETKEPATGEAGKGVCWVRPLAGSCRLLGNTDLELESNQYTPLAAHLWVDLRPGVRLQVTASESLRDPQLIWEGVDRLGALVRRHSDLLAAEEEAASVERARRLHAAATATIGRACARLASALQPESPAGVGPGAWDSPPDAESALLACCRLVGAALAMTIKTPSEWETSKSERDPLAAIIRSSRVMARKVALRGAWWQTDGGPLLAFLAEDKRPVALLRGPGGYQLHDPTTGAAPTPVDAQTAPAVAAFAYTLYRPFPNIRLGINALLAFGARACTRDIVVLSLMTLAITVLGMAPALATGLLFNSVIPGAQRSQLWQIALILVVCAGTNSGLTVVRGLALLRIQQRMGTSVQAAVWDRLMRLPLTFFRPYTAGDLATRAMSIDAIQQILSGATINAILSGILSVGNLAMMFYFSAAMAGRAVVLLAFAVAVTTLGGVLRLNPERRAMKLRSKTSGLVLQLLTSISKLRVAGAEIRAFGQWAERFAKQREEQYKVRLISNWLSAFTAAFPLLASVFIFMTALPSLGQGSAELRTGDFLAFGAAFSACLSGVLGTCTALVDALSSVSTYEQAKPILQALPESYVGRSDPGILSGDIEIQHGVFRYHEDGPPVLRDISLHIRPGEFVALVGPSGSGKSTILRLLLGFETLESGSIFYDGQELGGLDILEVRRQMGVVLQNGRLIVGDIFRNIAASSTATLAEAWEAAKMAGIDEDIKAMPMKMHTVIGEQAGTLSGGQRQRLMIARAIVNRPRILLFDEATSALDNRTQAIVTASLERLQATRVVVAHRLSTIAKADRIFVIERGKIVESGTYVQLMSDNGVFADLARRQLA